MAKALIIATTSARGYAQAAVACGYQVIALEAFIDADTKKICIQTFQLKFDNFALNEIYFKQVFLEIDLNNVEGFLYGSLFDSYPDLLEWVVAQVPVIGNSARVLQQAKAFNFFGLLEALNITHPAVQLQLPSRPEDWLSKQIGGCGGMHIQSASAPKNKNTYYQQKLAGTPMSMLFVADGNKAHLIGFNQQLNAPSKSLPYRFAGAVGNTSLQPSMHNAFEYAAQRLTGTLQLRGICSLDAIVDGENVWVLELNPRLSATFNLYENLLPLHLQGCAGHLPNILINTNTSHGQLILYADETLDIPQNFAWPRWVADIPIAESHDSDIKTSVKTNVKIGPHEPICSVLASAKSPELAHIVLLQRAEKLTEMLNI